MIADVRFREIARRSAFDNTGCSTPQIRCREADTGKTLLHHRLSIERMKECEARVELMLKIIERFKAASGYICPGLARQQRLFISESKKCL